MNFQNIMKVDSSLEVKFCNFHVISQRWKDLTDEIDWFALSERVQGISFLTPWQIPIVSTRLLLWMKGMWLFLIWCYQLPGRKHGAVWRAVVARVAVLALASPQELQKHYAFTPSEFPPWIGILQANAWCVSVIYRNCISQRGFWGPNRGRKKRVKLKPWAKQESQQIGELQWVSQAGARLKKEKTKKPKPI